MKINTQLKMSKEMICAEAGDALKSRQFVVYYQPQFNHDTGLAVGSEALVRWIHPEFGLQSPGDFIPVFEETGLISKLDLYVFENVCEFLSRCIRQKLPVVPISFNISRQDIYNEEFIDKLEQIRVRYDIPVRLLRVEITESSAATSNQYVSSIVEKLHKLGYLVEMDDFGSGFSSLNVLKDIEFDIIKLDIKFLRGCIGGRGGSILSSVVYMCKWLNTPLIAEGVETMEVADYMKSIGCNYIQGYLYSRPVPENEYLALFNKNGLSEINPDVRLINTLDAGKFWSPESLETLIFSNYVGGAAILRYNTESASVIRVNEKYLKEIGMNQSAYDVIQTDPGEHFDEENRIIYEAMLNRAIQSGDEEECETWRTFRSPCCGEEKLCIRAAARLLGNFDSQYIFYIMIRNITAEKKRFQGVYESDRRFRAASEQANVYAWEYTIATKEMRPCFRCMRDLGLPPLVRNYPEPAIEVGIFPLDYADMYRDMMKKIDEGIPKIEAVIPLTVGRIPFHVRYTTEFDEEGHPVKAYGSATLVINENN